MATVLLALSPVAHHLVGALPACRFKALFGIPCPTCGATRSALHLADFDFVEALTAYPLATVVWMGLIGGGLIAGVMALLGRGVPDYIGNIPTWARVLIVAVLLANWAFLIATGA